MSFLYTALTINLDSDGYAILLHRPTLRELQDVTRVLDISPHCRTTDYHNDWLLAFDPEDEAAQAVWFEGNDREATGLIV